MDRKEPTGTASAGYNPAVRCCGWCYSPDVRGSCAQCTRAYCSKQCQTDDWKMGRHKHWCGKAGEKGQDYEIRTSGEKGLGLFTKRDVRRGEKILVERPVATREGDGALQVAACRNTSVRRAYDALLPLEGGEEEKFATNCSCLEDNNDSGVFLNFSRVNHACIGNSAHYFEPLHGLKLLVANRDIPANSEVTFSYQCNQNSVERSFTLRFQYGFECQCCACKNPSLSLQLDKIQTLNRKVCDLGMNGKEEHAIRAGEALIRIYDELKVSDRCYANTYYEMFQMAIPRRKTVQKGVAFVKKAYKHALLFYGLRENSEVLKYHSYAENPSLHRNYRAIN